MNATTVQQLHKLIDIVNPDEYDTVYKVLIKFISEAMPLPDEIKTIERLDSAIKNGDTVRFEDINWN